MRHEKTASNYLAQMMTSSNKTSRTESSTPSKPKVSSTLELEKPVKTPQPLPASVTTEDKPDIQVFLEELPLYSEWQYTLAMAYYLFQFKLQPSFTAKSVRKQFREARHTVPNNIHLSVHTCVKKGYLKESGLADLQKTYEITESGILYIQGLKKIVPGSAHSIDSSVSGSNRTDRQTQLLSFTLEELQLDRNPNPSLLERLEDQALSILYIYKKELDFTHLSAQDVYTILHELFAFTYSPKAVQIALSRSRPRVEKIKYDGQMHYQLTQTGMEYMENLMRNQMLNQD